MLNKSVSNYSILIVTFVLWTLSNFFLIKIFVFKYDYSSCLLIGFFKSVQYVLVNNTFYTLVTVKNILASLTIPCLLNGHKIPENDRTQSYVIVFVLLLFETSRNDFEYLICFFTVITFNVIKNIY